MKASSRIKVGNQKNNPAYRTPSSFKVRQSIIARKPVKANKQTGRSK